MLRNQSDVIKRQPHYRLQKTTLGVASVLLSTTLYFGVAHADTVAQNQPVNDNGAATTEVEKPAAQENQTGAAVLKTPAPNQDAGKPAANQDAGNPAVQANDVNAKKTTPAVDNGAPSQTGGQKQVVNNDVSAHQPAGQKPAANSGNVQVAPKDTPKSTSDQNEDLQKQLTRTINITDPTTGKASSVTQTVTYTRKDANSPWTTDNNRFEAYSLPRVPGYLAYDVDGGNVVQNGHVTSVVTTPNMQNLIVNVAYRRENGSYTINLVDQDGAIVANQTVTGPANSTQKVNLTLPDGYLLNDDQHIPAEVTINGNSSVKIGVHALTVTVNADQPQTAGTPIPGTKNLKFPSGLGQNDLNRSITRTIKITGADGKVQTVVQPAVEFHRNATLNAATGKIAYGEWNQKSATVPAYNLDVPDGQVPIADGSLNAWPVAPDTLSITVNVRFAVSDASVVVQFVTGDDNEEVDETDVNGVIGQNVAVDLQVPAGWQLAPGQKLPTSVKLTSQDQEPIQIKVVEGHITVTPDNPKTSDDAIPGTDDNYNYPDGVTKDDLNKTVTRDIYTKLPGQDEHKIATQTVNVSRSADVNIIESTVTYGKWSNGTFTSYNAPEITGYTVDTATAPEANVEFDKSGNPINVKYVFNYKAATQAVADSKKVEHRIYVQRGDNTPALVQTQSVTVLRHGIKNLATGQTTWDDWESTTAPAVNAPDVPGYTVTNPDSGQNVLIDGTKDHVDTAFKYTANPQVAHVIYKDGDQVVKDQVLNGHTDEVIDAKVAAPAGYSVVSVDGNTNYDSAKDQYKFGPTNQDVVLHLKHNTVNRVEDKTITRTITIAFPDGKVNTVKEDAKLTRTGVYDQVTKQTSWEPWSNSVWNEYQVPEVTGYQPSMSVVAKQTVTGDTQPATVKITYIAQGQTVNIIYQDGVTGQTVKTTPLSGKTGETVDVHYDVPTGYHIDGQVQPHYTFGPKDNKDIVIKLAHNIDNDWHQDKKLTRTINVELPDGGNKVVKQTATITRDGAHDEVTNNTTWGKWSTSSWEAYNVPVVAGFTPSQTVVAKADVNGDTVDQTVNITYTANEETVNVVYKTPDGQVVKTQQISGKFGQTIKIPYDVPTNYHMTGKPATMYTFGDQVNPDVVVEVVPNTSETTDAKVVTRTINVHMPDGTVKTTKQTVTLTRDGEKNLVTGETTWSAWSKGAWDEFDVPAVAGYTPSQSVVNKQVVDGSTMDTVVNITYTANEQSVHVIYQMPDGTPVKTITVSGRTGQTVTIPNDVPDGYHTVGNVPTTITISDEKNPDVMITVEANKTNDHGQSHGTGTVVNNQTGHVQNAVNQPKINHGSVSTPQGQAVTSQRSQKTLPQTGNTDEATGLFGAALGMVATTLSLLGFKKKENQISFQNGD